MIAYQLFTIFAHFIRNYPQAEKPSSGKVVGTNWSVTGLTGVKILSSNVTDLNPDSVLPLLLSYWDIKVLAGTERLCGFFQRHCIAAHILTFYDYILFLDADFGVVNPKRRIEEYIDPSVDILFYDRFYNWEITAGSYLAKNTTWSKNFLLNFARYEKQLPKSFHGTDNGALHAYVAEVVLGENHTNLTLCLDIYKKSKNFHTLFLYEACIRKVLGDNIYLGKIKIIPKGAAWARDNWLTNSLWSLERDFIIHGWKENQLRNYSKTPVPIVSNSKSMWYNPLGGSINLGACTEWNTSWHYDKNLLVSKSDIERRLQDFAASVEKRKAAMLLELQNLKNVSKV